MLGGSIMNFPGYTDRCDSDIAVVETKDLGFVCGWTLSSGGVGVMFIAAPLLVLSGGGREDEGRLVRFSVSFNWLIRESSHTYASFCLFE